MVSTTHHHPSPISLEHHLDYTEEINRVGQGMGDLTGALSHGIIKYQVPYFPEGYRLETTNVKKEMQSDREMLGASVKNSACGKGHEEGGSTYSKVGSSLRSPPGNSRASTPKTRACLLYYFVLSPTPLTLWGAVPHHLSWRRSQLRAPVNKNCWA